MRFKNFIISLLALYFTVISLSAFAATLQISWNAPAGTIAGYHVYYQASGASTWTMVDAGNKTLLNVPGLPNGGTYCAQVTSYDAQGDESAKSSPTCASLKRMFFHHKLRLLNS